MSLTKRLEEVLESAEYAESYLDDTIGDLQDIIKKLKEL